MNDTLTNKQIAFIIFGIIAGYGLIKLPKDIAQISGTGGWIPVLIATGISIIITILITYLGYIHENKTFYEYSEMLIGKTLTNLFSVLFLIYYFVFFAMDTRISSELIKLTVLIKTPPCAMCLIFFLVVYYALTKGLKTIGKICELYGIIIIVSTLIIIVLISTEGKLINLRPFLGTKNFVDYIKDSIILIQPFIGFEILMIIPFSSENKKNIFKYTGLMILFIGIYYILIYEACISVMGADEIVHYIDAVFAVIRRVDIPYLEFLKRLDGIALILWIMGIFCTFLLFGYGAVFFANKLFKKLNYNLLALIIVILAFIFAVLPANNKQVQDIISYNVIFGLVITIVATIILLIVTKVKQYDKKK